MPPSVTELEPIAVDNSADESPVCDACTHPREIHDGIAARYCAATVSSALSRGCVCKVAMLVR